MTFWRKVEAKLNSNKSSSSSFFLIFHPHYHDHGHDHHCLHLQVLKAQMRHLNVNKLFRYWITSANEALIYFLTFGRPMNSCVYVSMYEVLGHFFSALVKIVSTLSFIHHQVCECCVIIWYSCLFDAFLLNAAKTAKLFTLHRSWR